MNIAHNSLISGAETAKGLTVIIDVFRASTTVCFILNNNAAGIIPVEKVQEAYSLKYLDHEYILVGERRGIKLSGFDYGNSPTEIKDVNFSGKHVVFTTSAGTKGIISASHSDEILIGGFVNSKAVVTYIKNKRPENVTLVSMGLRGEKKCDEDELCAVYIKQLLLHQSPDFVAIKNHLKTYKTARKFFDASKPHFPEKDFHYAMDLDRFSFVVKANRSKHRIILKKEDV